MLGKNFIVDIFLYWVHIGNLIVLSERIIKAYLSRYVGINGIYNNGHVIFFGRHVILTIIFPRNINWVQSKGTNLRRMTDR